MNKKMLLKSLLIVWLLISFSQSRALKCSTDSKPAAAASMAPLKKDIHFTPFGIAKW